MFGEDGETNAFMSICVVQSVRIPLSVLKRYENRTFQKQRSIICILNIGWKICCDNFVVNSSSLALFLKYM